MGLIGSYLERRRRRESAVQPEAGVGAPPDAPEPEPVGRPLDGAESDPGPSGLGPETDLTTVIGMLGMVRDAVQSGSIQIAHGQGPAADRQSDTSAEEVPRQIVALMDEHAIDPGELDGIEGIPDPDGAGKAG